MCSFVTFDTMDFYHRNKYIRAIQVTLLLCITNKIKFYVKISIIKSTCVSPDNFSKKKINKQIK